MREGGRICRTLRYISSLLLAQARPTMMNHLTSTIVVYLLAIEKLSNTILSFLTVNSPIT